MNLLKSTDPEGPCKGCAFQARCKSDLMSCTCFGEFVRTGSFVLKKSHMRDPSKARYRNLFRGEA